jgi:hypothetical protein
MNLQPKILASALVNNSNYKHERDVLVSISNNSKLLLQTFKDEMLQAIKQEIGQNLKNEISILAVREEKLNNLMKFF